jgi:hypothetical protein|tara:strand:+ start:361 stop:1758 length:1398 start_codon:yes stop_codon:yes gene_type:complete
MTDCAQQTFAFQALGSRRVEANFAGGHLSSDGGMLFLRDLEKRHGLIARLARCFHDARSADLIEHSVQSLLGQRLMGLAAGYEDLNDHDRLRLDPLLAMVCGKSDVLGQKRRREADRGKALAGKATLNRLELSALGGDGRYKKIVADEKAISALLIREGLARIPRKSRWLILDFDATDDRLHGAQEGRFFHGYYGHYCFLPLYCFCGNIPLWAQLRSSDRDASAGTVEALEKILPAIRRRFGRKVKVLVRADSGFAREAIMSWCENQTNVYYCLGLARNKRLQEALAPSFARLEETASGEEAPRRMYHDFTYKTRESWSRSRRVVGKAEYCGDKPNPRFIVTNLPAQMHEAAALYEKTYCARGAMENQIKAQQLDLFADRTSCTPLAANQLRLWFSAFAHLMLETLRAEVLRGTSLATATIGQIRLRFLKLAARVKVSCRRILIEWCSACPNPQDFQRAHRNLSG